MTQAQKNTAAVIAALLLLFGAGVVGNQLAPAPPPTSTTTTTTTTTTTVPATTGTSCSTGPPSTTPSPGIRWDRVPAAQIATSPRCRTDVPTHWAHGYTDHTLTDLTFLDGQERLRGPPGSALAAVDFSEPICHNPTSTIRAYWRPFFTGGFNIPRGAAIPWDATCAISGGTDGNTGVIDPQGHEWDLWAASTPTDQTAGRPQVGCQQDGNNLITQSIFAPNGLPPGTPPFDPGAGMCTALAVEVADSHGTPVDVRTFLGNSPASTGAGTIASYDLPSPTDVQTAITGHARSLGHALKLAIANTQPGPICPATTPLTSPAVGVSCGIAVAPAGKVEQAGNVNLSRLPNTIPEGTRFALTLTDSQITAYLDARHLVGVERATVELYAHTLVDDGFYVGDTSDRNASIIVDGNDPTGWANLGIPTASSSQELAGLITSPGMIRELAPPVNACASVPPTLSVLACAADSIAY